MFSKTAAMIGAWLAGLACARGDWKLESSEKLAAASPFVTLVRKTAVNGRQVEIHAVFFNVKQCGLRVIDDAEGTATLEAAMRAHGCLAGVNGNYFHPDRTSLGLVISDGKQLHGMERAKLLSGVLVVKAGRFSLLRVAEFAPDASITQALQAGPFLVDKGAAVTGLEGTRRAERTVVISDEKGDGALVVCSGVTLAEMGAILATPGVITEMRVERALNLDGGSSTGMWVDAAPKPFYMEEIKEVRNYLGVVAREK